MEIEINQNINHETNRGWLIIRSSSGIRLEITKAALPEGNKVMATGRDLGKVTKAFAGFGDNI
ncbi:MAG: hypothetical protein ACOH2V_07515 [Candidatus Saccharimonadaceae bacterium]